jgi:hypothetical protein
MNFVASRSITNICNHHIINPRTSSTEIPSTFPITSGESIYVNPEALNNFIVNYLPKLTMPFILVTGDSDATIPSDFQNESSQILNHPLLICWYAQNCVSPSEKLKQIPIGLDFHTLASRHHDWGHQQSIESQTNDIIKLRATSKNRLNKCYANFQFLMTTRYANDRRDAIANISPALVFYEPVKTSRILCWENMIKYKYVISPQGNGLDCHRTWEALALGCIPIVKESPLDPLFRGLPVMIVNNWKDITQEMLDTFVPNYTEISRLELSHWSAIFDKKCGFHLSKDTLPRQHTMINLGKLIRKGLLGKR